MTPPSEATSNSLRDFRDLVDGKRLLITGGTGSFGRTLVRACLGGTDAQEILVYSRDEQKHVAMHREVTDPRLRSVLGDVRDLERLRFCLRGVDFVFHAAALKHVHFTEEHPLEAVRTNILGTQFVCQAAIEAGVQTLVSLSTDKSVEPVNVMGMTKALSERLVSSFAGHGMRVGIVRYGNVLASNGSVIPYFLRLLSEGAEALPVTDRRMTRFVLTLDDSVRLVRHAFCNCQDGEIFALDLPAISIWQAAEILADAAGSSIRVEEVGIRPGEKLHETLISAEEMRRATRENDVWMIRPYRSSEERFPAARAERCLISDSATLLADVEVRDLLERQGCLPAVRGHGE